MLGKASELRTWRVESTCEITPTELVCSGVDNEINQVLTTLSKINADVLSIQYQASQNENIADSALIIYREAPPNA